MFDAVLEIRPLQVGDASSIALFGLALAIMLWPLGRRLAEARRQRVHESRIAAGQADERK
jgi:hypothetical protein